MKKISMLDIITFLFIVLFLYAATVKLLQFELFKAQIAMSPLIMNHSVMFAWLVPSVEIIIVILLFTNRWKIVGLYASFTLMFAFTAYIAFILYFSPYVPCSCGGILNKMGWSEHLIFNTCFTALGVWGIVLQLKETRRNNNVAFA